ncbi:hypothetical protein LU640_05025 [Pseudomonas monteilii]|uniref:hypothetical protein n=1 Tax=Pseudomonas monteilii TaxID=76759 RepID=UPI001E5679D7|nr:hypothetical protein [Pseudomonas monteilii]MCE1016643.1 hypothetical protein [Pseudomonas monteilii]MCE1033876.1 hypothetical protein [Pseudomonas monteilii]MCE1086016.1 hypothetical protein [Pseudomonas monteilii]
MGRYIGPGGEHIIQYWCELSGITANRSDPDRHGWDLHFEMPQLASIINAGGLHEANIECKVQVKTTDTKKKSEPIRLSSLRAMATSTLPTFYILIELAGGQQVMAAHLLHIDESHCSKILERIRRETAKPGKIDLNKKTMSLDFRNGVKILPLNGDGLKAEILKCIGPSQSDYVIKKQKFIKSCGFDPDSFKINFKVDTEHTDKFVRMLLGESDSVEVKAVEGTVTRFGISEPLAELQSDTAIVSLGNIMPDGFAKVVFRNRKTGTALEFGFDIYRGGAIACVPAKFRVVRLKSERFSIDLSMYDNSMNIFFHTREDIECDIAELLKNYKLIKLMTCPSDVDFNIEIEGKTLNGKFSGTGFEGDFDKSLEMLESANYVKNFYEYHSTLKVVPEWFARNGHTLVDGAKFLKDFSTLNKVILGFTLADGSTDLADAECIAAIPVLVGDICFVSLFAYGGHLVNKGGASYELTPTKVEVIYKTHFTIEYLASGKAVRDLEEAVDRYEGAETVVPFIDTYMDPLVASAKRALSKEIGPL